MTSRRLLAAGMILAASAAFSLEGTSKQASGKKSAIPDGSFVFAYSKEGDTDQMVLGQLSCFLGECVLASAILTPCEQRTGRPRRSLGLDTTSTRSGRLTVSAERSGELVVLSAEERIPFGVVQYRFTVKLDELGTPRLENFSGISQEKSLRSSTTALRKLQRLTPAERKSLPSCGLQLLENVFEFGQQ
jgi:hypothetical protein